VIDPRRSGVGGGDVVRDCAVVEYVPLSFSIFLPFSFLTSTLIANFLYFAVHDLCQVFLPYPYPYRSDKANNQTPSRPL
jgi:hypothetical protein